MSSENKRFPMPSSDTSSEQAAAERVIEKLTGNPQIPAPGLQDALLPDDTLTGDTGLSMPMDQVRPILTDSQTVIDAEVVSFNTKRSAEINEQEETMGATNSSLPKNESVFVALVEPTLPSEKHHKKKKKKHHPRIEKAKTFVMSLGETDLTEGIAVTPEKKLMSGGLVEILNREDFNRIGSVIRESLNTGPVTSDEILEAAETADINIPPEVIKAIVETFVETGFIDRSKKGELKFTSRGNEISGLGYDEVNSAVLAFNALIQIDPPHRFNSIEEVEAAHQIQASDRVDEVEVAPDKPSAKILYLSQILVGNYGTDITALRALVKKVRKNPKQLRPDVTVVSGIMEGPHDYVNKEKRHGLQKGLESLDAQFSAAKQVFDEISRVGGKNGKIVYIIGASDREIVKDGTFKTLIMLKEQGDALVDRGTDRVYWEQDRLRRDKLYEKIYAFQLNVVLPYSFKTGRRLRSESEISTLTGGKLRMEEFLMLWEAYNALATGKPVPNEYKNILEIGNIVFPNDQSNFMIHDGADLDILDKNLDFTISVRDGLTFSDTPTYGDPTAAARKYLAQVNSNGLPHSKILVNMSQQDPFAIGSAEDDFVISIPGFTDSQRAMQVKSTKAKAGHPTPWRLFQRGSLTKPAGVMYEHTDDGRMITTLLNPTFIEMADAGPRTAVVTNTDWQTGSRTARPDLQIKFTDYWMSRILPEMPVYLASDGDIIQGRNYPDMPNENEDVGLITIDSQKAFVRKMFERATEHVSADDLRNIQKFMIVPGNHEWNSGYDKNGASHNEYLEHMFESMLLRKGIIPTPGLIQVYRAMTTGYGDSLRGWTAVEENIAGYGFMFQHMLLEKGGKGAGNRPSVYQAAELFGGLGDLTEKIQFGKFGHWHHYMMRLFANKAAIVDPSLAGLSGYEWARGYRPQMGAVIVYVGGGLPPQIELLTAPMLATYKIEHGVFSPESLAREKLKDPRHFDPLRNGFFDGSPQSAQQQYLHGLIKEVNGTSQSNITRTKIRR